MSGTDVKSNSLKRLITGFIIGIIGLLCFSAGGIFLFLLVTAFIFAGSFELVKILRAKGVSPYITIVLAVNFLFLTIFASGKLDLYPFAMAIGVISSFLAVLFNGHQPYIANISSTIFCFTYGSLPCYMLLIREMTTPKYVIDFLPFFNAGFYFLLLIFFAVLFTDVCAYYFGKRIGKTPLAPVISPKKTVEGAIAGSIGAIVAAFIIGSLIKLPWYHSIILGVLITLFAQLGDLCESLIKRDAGVKDSGNALAGHGGFLDRTDSYIFSIPVAYFYLHFFILNSNILHQIVNELRRLIHAF